MSEVFLVGLSHHSAPIAVREQVALSGEELKGALVSLRAAPGVHEAMVISTCNRVEVYVLADQAEPARRFFLDRAADADGGQHRLAWAVPRPQLRGAARCLASRA